jgi:hypothetical protein
MTTARTRKTTETPPADTNPPAMAADAQGASPGVLHMPAKPVHEAWSDVMNTVLALGKHEQHDSPGAKFNYRGIDALMNAVGPVLRQHRMSILPSVKDVQRRDVQTSTGKASREVSVLVDYAIYGPAGDVMYGTSVGEAMDSGDKGTAKAMSVAYRVFLLQSLCVRPAVRGPRPGAVREAPGRGRCRPWWRAVRSGRDQRRPGCGRGGRPMTWWGMALISVVLVALPLTLWLKRAGEEEWARYQARRRREAMARGLERLTASFMTMGDAMAKAGARFARLGTSLSRSLSEVHGTWPDPLPCPECRNGKCVNCTGEALDESADEIVPCECKHGAA